MGEREEARGRVVVILVNSHTLELAQNANRHFPMVLER